MRFDWLNVFNRAGHWELRYVVNINFIGLYTFLVFWALWNQSFDFDVIDLITILLGFLMSYFYLTVLYFGYKIFESLYNRYLKTYVHQYFKIMPTQVQNKE